MNKPILFLTAHDASVLKSLKADLGRRFGRDCQLLSACSPAEGLDVLRALAENQGPWPS